MVSDTYASNIFFCLERGVLFSILGILICIAVNSIKKLVWQKIKVSIFILSSRIIVPSNFNAITSLVRYFSHHHVQNYISEENTFSSEDKHTVNKKAGLLQVL